MKQIVVHCEPKVTQTALLEEGRLVEYNIENELEVKRAGSIYLGRVVNVLPGMQAAFVDIGLKKNAFLYIDDLLPVHLAKQPQIKPLITDLVTVGQTFVVQISKEPEGNKGPKVTTHYSIPGRWIVYMPNADYIAISRKIESEAEKNRLKLIVEEMRYNGEGIIVRTVAQAQSEHSLERDLGDLRELWNAIQSSANENKIPSLLYKDLDILPRMARDVIDEDIAEIWIDDPFVCKEMYSILRLQSPGLEQRVKCYEDTVPIWDLFHITEELDKSFQRKIWLGSGGYLVIDRAEALTVIDVNTGRYTGSIDLEQTVFDINLEAAVEIARLIRLRNIRGIIIVDFIDMELEEHRSAILEAMGHEVKKDRSKTVIVGWTKLGLLELTRKRK